MKFWKYLNPKMMIFPTFLEFRDVGIKKNSIFPMIKLKWLDLVII